MVLGVMAIFLGESCSYGPEIDQTRVDNIVVDKTTRDEIDEWFGSPTTQSRVTDAKNNSVLIYTYQWMRGSQITGALASKTLTVWFNKQGVVVDRNLAEWRK